MFGVLDQLFLLVHLTAAERSGVLCSYFVVLRETLLEIHLSLRFISSH